MYRLAAPEFCKKIISQRQHNFELIAHTKGGDFRAWKLRPAEEIKLELEDNMLNLQVGV